MARSATARPRRSPSSARPRASIQAGAASPWRSTAASSRAPNGGTFSSSPGTASRSCAPSRGADVDSLTIAGETLRSRLFLGTAGYPNQQILLEAVEASGCEIVTLSIRRISLAGHGADTVNLLSGYRFLPNTAGCETARDAILTAELAREALGTNWIKLEIIGDRETLYPDVQELVTATQDLVNRGFVVLPYCNDDPVVCRRLADLGEVPVIVDAGIGTASDAVIAMELGAAAVLLNTAVAKAADPVTMAAAMRHAVEAGRLAHLAGRIPRRTRAEPSSPQLGLVGS